MTAVTTRPLETGWLRDTPVDDSVLRQFIHNQAEVNALVALACGGRAEHTDEVFLADAASLVPYFNQAILARPLVGGADPVLGEVDRFFAGSPRPATLLSLWPTPDLSTRGWILAGHPMFVLRGPGAPAARSPGPGVEVRRARDAADLVTAERVAIEGYPVDEAAGAPAGTVFPPALSGTGLSVRLGLLDGVPVGVGNSYVGAGVVNLCLGATLPAARRRGVWEALVWARLGDAPGLPGVAFTSDFSRPGFLRMGFLPVSRLTLWVLPPSQDPTPAR
jgi:hypothetical protein